MNDDYFAELVKEMTPEDIESPYFKKVAEMFDVVVAGKLISLFDEHYSGSKEGQRRIPVPRKSSFIRKPNQRKIDGDVSRAT